MIGVMGGSFNPVHSGHMMVASWMAQFGGFDSILLVLTPLNPLKTGVSDGLADDSHRLKMLHIAASNASNVMVSDIELSLPRPNYTYNTLTELRKQDPSEQYRLIIGSDNWTLFPQWRNGKEIIREFGVTIYPRPGFAVDCNSLPEGVNMLKAPMVEVSSTFIRDSIARGYDMRSFLPAGVADYINSHGLY